MRASDNDHVISTNGTSDTAHNAGGSIVGGDGRNLRKSGTEVVDSEVAKRMKEAEGIEEKRKKDAAFLQRFNDRINEVGVGF